MIDDLLLILDKENVSCVIRNNGIIRTFARRGVADLFDLLQNEPDYLNGAEIADKVVGKAAAFIMAKGGVSKLVTHVASEMSMQVFKANGIIVKCDKLVPHIINREGSDWCPMEKLLKDISSVDSALPIIKEFLNSKKKSV